MADGNTLNIINYFQREIAVGVTGDNFNCCDSPKPGAQVGSITAGGTRPLAYVRTDGHGCNGRQGEFELAVDASLKVQLNFDSHGSIQLSSAPTNFGAYISQDANGSFNLVVGPTPHAG